MKPRETNTSDKIVQFPVDKKADFYWKRVWKSSNTNEENQHYSEILRWATGSESLKGKDVIDVGCGLSVSSYAALKMGAESIIGFDNCKNILNYSIEYVWGKKANKPRNWRILYGSVIDNSFIESLPKADIVIALGVFWITGNMLKALEESLKLVKDNGIIIFSYYNKTPKTDATLRAHKIISRAPKLIKVIIAHLLLAKNILHSIYALIIRPHNINKNVIKELFTRNWYMRSYPWWLEAVSVESCTLDQIKSICSKYNSQMIKGPGERFQGEHHILVFRKT